MTKLQIKYNCTLTTHYYVPGMRIRPSHKSRIPLAMAPPAVSARLKGCMLLLCAAPSFAFCPGFYHASLRTKSCEAALGLSFSSGMRLSRREAHPNFLSSIASKGGNQDSSGEEALSFWEMLTGPLQQAFVQDRRETLHIQDVLLGRRTINDFDVELPENWEGAIMTAIEAATYAPNHRRTEPWRFHLLGPKSIQAVCELNAEMVAAKKGEAAGAKKRERWMAIPGWLVVTQHAEDPKEGDMEQANSVLREDYAACCCAVQNLCLSLHAQGIGTKWTTGDVNFDTRFREAAGIPSTERVVGTIWFGRAAKTPPPPKKRLSVDDVLFLHQ